MSTVGLGGSILFWQLLPSPVYASVCYLLDWLKWWRSSSGVSLRVQSSEVVSVAKWLEHLTLGAGSGVRICWLHAGKVRAALSCHSLVPSLRTARDIFSGIGLCFFITHFNDVFTFHLTSIYCQVMNEIMIMNFFLLALLDQIR